MDYGKFLKNMRESKGISRYRLAKIAGISQENIRHWELGISKMRIDNAEKVFAALGMKIQIVEVDDD